MISQEEIRQIVYPAMEYDKPYSIEKIYEMVIDSYDFNNGHPSDLRTFQDRIRGFLAQEKKAGRMNNISHGVWIRLATPAPKKRRRQTTSLDQRVASLEGTVASLRKALIP